VAKGCDNLQRIYEEAGQTCVYDFDFTKASHEEAQVHLLKCIIAFTKGAIERKQKDVDLFTMCCGDYNNKQRAFLEEYIEHMLKVCVTNQYSLHLPNEFDGNSFVELGFSLLPFSSLINHSCEPNVFWIPFENKYVFVVARPIKPDEQLFHCYR